MAIQVEIRFFQGSQGGTTKAHFGTHHLGPVEYVHATERYIEVKTKEDGIFRYPYEKLIYLHETDDGEEG